MGWLIRFLAVVPLAALAPISDAEDRVPLHCVQPAPHGACALYQLSIYQLLANPEGYDGQRVQVIGYIHFEFEGNGLYPHKEDFDHHLVFNGLWVDMAKGVSHDACQDSYAIVEGTFRARETGHMGMWSGAITDITRCVRSP